MLDSEGTRHIMLQWKERKSMGKDTTFNIWQEMAKVEHTL